jgi:hypothetical protein
MIWAALVRVKFYRGCSSTDGLPGPVRVDLSWRENLLVERSFSLSRSKANLHQSLFSGTPRATWEWPWSPLWRTAPANFAGAKRRFGRACVVKLADLKRMTSRLGRRRPLGRSRRGNLPTASTVITAPGSLSDSLRLRRDPFVVSRGDGASPDMREIHHLETFAWWYALVAHVPRRR